MRFMNFAYDFTADVIAFQPHFESGVEWHSVGGLWQAIDRGESCDHYSATVTIEDAYENIEHARHNLLECAQATGLLLMVICDESEKIFGSEFFYGSGYPYDCLVVAQEEPFVTETPDGRSIGRWTFTLNVLTDMTTRVRYPGLVLPSDAQVVSIDKKKNLKATDHKLYSGYAKVDNLHREPVTTLTYVGTSAAIGALKRYFITKRTNTFTLDSPIGLYYFTHTVQSQAVYFYDLNEVGGLNQDSSVGEVDITLMLAG